MQHTSRQRRHDSIARVTSSGCFFFFILAYVLFCSVFPCPPQPPSPPGGEGRRGKKKKKNFAAGASLPPNAFPFGYFFSAFAASACSWAPPGRARAHAHTCTQRVHCVASDSRPNTPPLPRVSLSQDHNNKAAVCRASLDGGEEGFCFVVSVADCGRRKKKH